MFSFAAACRSLTFTPMKQVKPKKQLGQHFLTDLSIARRIADTVDACPDIPVLEIGPGMGVLTQYLITKPRQVCAVEIDRESIVYLRQHFPEFATPFSLGEGQGEGAPVSFGEESAYSFTMPVGRVAEDYVPYGK